MSVQEFKVCKKWVLFLLLFGVQKSRNQPSLQLLQWKNQSKCEQCLPITSCPELQQEIQSKPLSSQGFSFYDILSCGFQGFVPLYCCDKDLIERVFQSPLSRTDELAMVPPGDDERVRRLEKNHMQCEARRESKVIGGNDAASGMFAFVVNMGYTVWREENTTLPVFRCGGSLVTSFHVLTAAHCVRGLPPFYSLTAVRVGADLEDGRNLFRPEWKRAHPDYDKIKLINDIALVKLNRRVTDSGDIRPICLPFGKYDQTAKQVERRQFLVAGWGVVDTNTPPTVPETLQFAPFNLLDREECSKILSKRYRYSLTKQQICTVTENGKDSCGGDSGGPLFFQIKENSRTAVVIGLVSFGAKKCGDPEVPGVYTDVRAYKDFILDNLV